MKIFILDNYDSFTYNLVHIIEQFTDEVVAKRNDQIDLSELDNFDKIVFSPGPGLPSDIKIMNEIIDLYKHSKPILGVCLGHQAIAEHFGATLLNMTEVNHGREFETQITLKDYIYDNIPNTISTGRYHSWVVSKENFPTELEITSIDEQTVNIMSLRHKIYDIRGVQYHPESIMTKYGFQILKNWINK